MEQLMYRDEAIKSLRNRCEIYLLLRHQALPLQVEHLCKTILEDIGYFAQAIQDEYCVEK